MANKVVVCDRPRAIGWEPGQDAAGDGNLSFGAGFGVMTCAAPDRLVLT